jgi:hypothetical protein
MPASPPLTGASPVSGTSRSSRSFLTLPRIAFAGALAAAILIVAAVVSVERSRVAAPVEVADSRQPQPVTPREEEPAKQIAPSAAKQPSSAAQNAPPATAFEKRTEVPSAARRDAPAVAPISRQIAAGTSALQSSASAPAEQLSAAKPNAPVADERRPAAESAANSVKDALKESERKDEAGAVAARPRAAQSVTPAPAAPPPPPSVAKKAEESDLATKRQALAQGFVAGLMSKARSAESSRVAATVTDINGTIVSINAGTDAGLKNTDTLEIVRDGAVLGTVRLSDTRAAFAVGTLTRSPGADPPHAGDSVRLQATPPVR